MLSLVAYLLSLVATPQFFPFPRPPAPDALTKTIVQACGNGASSNTVTCTFGSTITAGNTLYACVGYSHGGTPSFSGDSDTYTTDPGGSVAISAIQWNTSAFGGFGVYVKCAYVLSATGGGNSITASGASSIQMVIVGVEIHGTSSLDTSENGSAQNAIGSTATSGSITPSNNGDMLIGVCMNSLNATITAGTNVSWSSVGSLVSVTPYSLLESYVQPTAGSVTAQCALSASQGYWGHVVAFH